MPSSLWTGFFKFNAAIMTECLCRGQLHAQSQLELRSAADPEMLLSSALLRITARVLWLFP
jgi:hypothetical protein